MVKRLFMTVVMLCAAMRAQVPVTPIVQPHVTFVNASGGPCATCTLQSFIAGTSTPTPTYTDATGVSQNTNPIILDPAGGADVWLSNLSYKLVLKDPQGTILWTVDQVKGGAGLGGICGPAGAIQIANTGVNGVTCDPNITINTTSHTLNVGTLPASYVTIGAAGTPTTWTFDTSSPATALASIGGASANAAGVVGQIAVYPGSGTTVGPSSSIPNGITAATQTINDNSTKIATTAYVSNPGTIDPDEIMLNSGGFMNDNQGTGAKLQHSIGPVTPGNCTQFDISGNTVDSGNPCSSGLTATQTNQTSARALGGTYQNTGGSPLMVQGYLITTAGGADGSITCQNGPTSSLGDTPFIDNPTATDAGGHAEFHILVPTGWFYQCSAGGTMNPALGQWFETSLQ